MKTHTAKSSSEREPTLIGDASAVERFLNTPSKKASFPGDPLANHISRLLELHPTLEVSFRKVDLASMDEATKKTLLHDINVVLGITPLKSHA